MIPNLKQALLEFGGLGKEFSDISPGNRLNSIFRKTWLLFKLKLTSLSRYI
jgi:hypothetical protein